MDMPSTKKGYRMGLLIVALVLLGAGCTEPTGIGVDIGQEAPDFVTTDFAGQGVSLSDYIGEKVLLDFWAMWCSFCAKEIPEIQALHEQYPDMNVIGVHRTATESLADAQSFIQELGVTYQMLSDEDNSIYNTFSGGRPFMPLAVLIDEQGIVQHRLIGPKTEEQIKQLFK